MKISTFIFALFISSVQFLFAQTDVSQQIKTLAAHVENEEIMQAIGLADQMIADGIKEGGGKDAAQVYLYRGIAKHMVEIDDDAIIDLKVAITLDSKLREAYLHIADIYYGMNSFSSSLENVIYYLEDGDGDDIQGLAIQSKCELKLGEIAAAKLTIQKAISIKSSEPELYYIRAVINKELGEDKLACKDAVIAVKFGFSDAQKFVDSHCGEE